MDEGVPERPLSGADLVKDVCKRIRYARSLWEAHNNAACRGEREKALALYGTLSKEQKDSIPQELRVWLRYRSEKYFGAGRSQPGGARKTPRPGQARKTGRNQGQGKGDNG